MKSAVIILSQKLLGAEYQNRLKKGINIYKKNNLDYIILPSESVNDKNIQFLENADIQTKKILTEANSKDTIGEAYLIKENILLPYNIDKVYVVSSDYHIEYRAKIIFDFVLGNDFDIIYCCVPTEKMRIRNVIINQLKSLGDFNNLVQETKDENLLINHSLYKEEGGQIK